MNFSSRDEFQQQLSRLEEEMRSTKASFDEAWNAASALLREFLSPREATGDRRLSIEERDAFDTALGEAFRSEQPRPAPSLSSIALSAEIDHYIESPFIDPFDCFDEADPADSFPFEDTAPAPLQGLFESDPDISIFPATDGSDESPEVEIEFPEEGGYRLRSRPRKSPKDVDSQDGLAF